MPKLIREKIMNNPLWGGPLALRRTVQPSCAASQGVASRGGSGIDHPGQRTIRTRFPRRLPKLEHPSDRNTTDEMAPARSVGTNRNDHGGQAHFGHNTTENELLRPNRSFEDSKLLLTLHRGLEYLKEPSPARTAKPNDGATQTDGPRDIVLCDYLGNAVASAIAELRGPAKCVRGRAAYPSWVGTCVPLIPPNVGDDGLCQKHREGLRYGPPASFLAWACIFASCLLVCASEDIANLGLLICVVRECVLSAAVISLHLECFDSASRHKTSASTAVLSMDTLRILANATSLRLNSLWTTVATLTRLIGTLQCCFLMRANLTRPGFVCQSILVGAAHYGQLLDSPSHLWYNV